MTIHAQSFSPIAAAAFAADGLIGMRDATDKTKITPCTATGKPLAIVEDAVEAGELANAHYLGLATETKEGVASAAIAIDADVYPATGGKLQTLPTAAGTYYKVGVARMTAAADGDVVGFIPCAPTPVIVPES